MKGHLSMLCGKMGSGKSTFAQRLAWQDGGILISEDEWLLELYEGKIQTLSDYMHFSGLLKIPIRKLVQQLLRKGCHVVMDFPANTQGQRRWLREIYAEVEATGTLYYLDLPDPTCLARIKQRAVEQPERVATDTVSMFFETSRYFSVPELSEAYRSLLLIDDLMGLHLCGLRLDPADGLLDIIGELAQRMVLAHGRHDQRAS